MLKTYLVPPLLLRKSGIAAGLSDFTNKQNRTSGPFRTLGTHPPKSYLRWQLSAEADLERGTFSGPEVVARSNCISRNVIVQHEGLCSWTAQSGPPYLLQDQFYGVERRADWSKLREHCRYVATLIFTPLSVNSRARECSALQILYSPPSSGKTEIRQPAICLFDIPQPTSVAGMLLTRLCLLHQPEPSLGPLTCRMYGLRFPLLVARLACMVVSGSVEPDVLKTLCFVRTDSAYPRQVNNRPSFFCSLWSNLNRVVWLRHPQLERFFLLLPSVWVWHYLRVGNADWLWRLAYIGSDVPNLLCDILNRHLLERITTFSEVVRALL